MKSFNSSKRFYVIGNKLLKHRCFEMNHSILLICVQLLDVTIFLRIFKVASQSNIFKCTFRTTKLKIGRKLVLSMFNMSDYLRIL